MFQATFSPECDCLRSEQQDDHERTSFLFVSLIICARFLFRDACLFLSYLNAAGQLAAALIREEMGKPSGCCPRLKSCHGTSLLWCAVILEKWLEKKKKERGKLGVGGSNGICSPWY